jgi:hypothetical protein
MTAFIPTYAASFDGIDNSLSTLYRTSDAKSCSISPENPTGEPGKGAMATEGISKHYARNLGQGWKINPAVRIQPGQVLVMGETQGPGAIEHIWLTAAGNWRTAILRIYWDNENDPSVEVPVGDFFGMGLGKYAPINSIPVAVNPGSGFNSYWPMPFRKKFRMTLENIGAKEMTLYYQVDYVLTKVPKDAAYFHAQFRRTNPVKEGDVYTILDNVSGQGQYVGTYMAWGINHAGWWGEGEIKFYLDGDLDFPTIAGTGTEDYFCGSYDFVNPTTRQYEPFSHNYSGMPQVIRSEDRDQHPKFGLYRWHITDPIRFKEKFRVTIQDLGWKKVSTAEEAEYRLGQDDISSVAFWYQTEPHKTFPHLPSKEELEAE